MAAALAVALAALHFRLVPGDERSEPGWVEAAGLFAFYAAALSWLWLGAPPAPRAIPPFPDARDALHRAELCVAFGAAACAFAARRPVWLARGAVLGAVSAWLGVFAARLLVAARAWELMGWFLGPFARWTLPFALAGALAAAALALFHEDFRPVRAGLLAAVILGSAGLSELSLARLRSSYGLGPVDLAAAAHVPGAGSAPLVGIAWLYPSTTTAAGYSIESKKAAVEGVDAQGESLIRVYAYLKAGDFRAVFAREALLALRRGWLFWWDADRALESAMLDRPGRVHPDYLQALALLRAGPLTLERFQKLRALGDIGRERKAGFEDVNRSQLIFEAFSAAFARFGDEEGARGWLFKVDNLWPIYEKKVEAAPVESFHDGSISGSLETPGRSPSSLLVGLFLVSTSTSASVARSTPTLSMSDFPDEDGRFSFRDLGAGSYFLGLEGQPEAFLGPIEGAPGVVCVSSETPTARLAPIRVLPAANP